MTRKSPIKHPVKQHLRKGRVVHRYERGDGKAPRQSIGRVRKLGGYTVTVMGDRTETFGVDAGSYLGALDSGINRASTTPQAIRIRRR